MPKQQIYLVHSRADAFPPTSLQQAFIDSNLNLYHAEFRYIEDPPWLTLKEEIRHSLAIFFLKAPNAAELPHARNWVCWELGVAATHNKPVWVFESLNNPVFMPLPYLTDYVPYNPDYPDHDLFIRILLDNYLYHQRQPEGIAMNCKQCGISYGLHTLVHTWNCPSCQRPQEWIDPNTPAQLQPLPELLQVHDTYLARFSRAYSQVSTD